ncbi:MAG: peptidylprolyl isomerase [Clostridia bacterium]|nr:peptidylprolyl isomerase [Clostridia bacterium]
MKKFLCLILALILLSLSLVSCTSKEEKALLEVVSYSEEITNYVVMEIEDLGYIVVELYPDVAPETVENFQTLVDDGFYNGLIFHRVIKGFMIQGGDPDGNGTGGSDKTIKGEFASNGFENNLSHKRGVISMARSNHPDSASSQFFICDADSPHLDGEYAAFGEVIYGIEVVDEIASVKKSLANDKPYTDVVIKSMKFVTKNEA